MFTVMTVAPFFPKTWLLGKMRAVLTADPLSFVANKLAILKTIKSVANMVDAWFVWGKKMAKMWVRSLDDLNDLLNSAKSKNIKTIDEYAKLWLNSFDEIAPFVKSSADFVKYLDNFDDALKPEIIKKLWDSIKKFDDLASIGIRSIDDLVDFKKKYLSSGSFEDFLKFSKLNIDDVSKLCKSPQDLAKLCDNSIDNLTTLIKDKPWSNTLKQLKINNVSDIVDWFGSWNPKKVDFTKVKWLLDQKKLFDEIKNLNPRNIQDLQEIGIDKDIFADLVKPWSPQKIFQLGVHSSANLRTIFGSWNPDPDWLKKIWLDKIETFDDFIKKTQTDAQTKLKTLKNDALAQWLKDLDIVWPEKLKSLLNVTLDDLVEKWIRGKTSLASIGITHIDDLNVIWVKSWSNLSMHEIINKLNLNSADDLASFGIKSIDDLQKKILSNLTGDELQKALNQSLWLKSMDDLIKLWWNSVDDLTKLEIKGAEKMQKRGLKSVQDLKKYNITINDLYDKLEIKTLDDLAKFNIKNYKDLLTLWPIQNAADILQKYSIVGREASVKFGLQTINDFRQINIYTLTDLKKIVTELWSTWDNVALAKEIWWTPDALRQWLASQTDAPTMQLKKWGKVTSSKTDNLADIDAELKQTTPSFRIEDIFGKWSQILDFDKSLDQALKQNHTNFITKIWSSLPWMPQKVRDWFKNMPDRWRSFLVDKWQDYVAYMRSLKSQDIGTRSMILQILKDSGAYVRSPLKWVSMKWIAIKWWWYAWQWFKWVWSYIKQHPLQSLYIVNKIDGQYGQEQYDQQTTDVEEELAQIDADICDHEVRYGTQEQDLDIFICDDEQNGQKWAMESGVVELDESTETCAELGICDMLDQIIKNKDIILDGPDWAYQIEIIGMSSKTWSKSKNVKLATSRAQLGMDYLNGRRSDLFDQKLSEQSNNQLKDEEREWLKNLLFSNKIWITQVTQTNLWEDYDPQKHNIGDIRSAEDYYKQFQWFQYKLVKNDWTSTGSAPWAS